MLDQQHYIRQDVYSSDTNTLARVEYRGYRDTMANPEEVPMRRFHFNRVEDASGVSGTGRVAEGVLFDNGLVALTWNSVHKCVNIYTSLAEMMAVHGHEGKTVLVWVDGDPNEVGGY